MNSLPAPHGGILRNCYASPETKEAINEQSKQLPSWPLSPRQLCDVELLLDGSFSPLEGFMSQAEHAAVLDRMRLPDGTFWPLPITLDVPEPFAADLNIGDRVALRDAEGVLIALMTVTDRFVPDRSEEARLLYGSASATHPGVDLLLNRTHPVRLGGPLLGVAPPTHYAFNHLRNTPRQLRADLAERETPRVAAFHTDGLIHRMQLTSLVESMRRHSTTLLIHPAVGAGRADDADLFTRVRCYERSLDHFPDKTVLHLIEIARRWAGPREALLHAIVRQNFGCSHFIVDGERFAADAKTPNGDTTDVDGFEQQFAALWEQYRHDLAITCVPLERFAYVEALSRFLPAAVAADDGQCPMSEADVRHRLSEGVDLPSWFTFPEVLDELRHTNPPRYRQGFTIFFTGLSGAGKSTVANALLVRLMAIGGRPVTLLDGDVVRMRLSSELGFSREHRDLNILRIGYVASEITKNGGIAICAPIAPYANTRRQVREMVEAVGGFTEVHVATPISVCEKRDRKGLYAKAHAGLLKGLTGVDDPYETPEAPELRLDTSKTAPAEAVDRIIDMLTDLGYLASLNATVTPLHLRTRERHQTERFTRTPDKRA